MKKRNNAKTKLVRDTQTKKKITKSNKSLKQKKNIKSLKQKKNAKSLKQKKNIKKFKTKRTTRLKENKVMKGGYSSPWLDFDLPASISHSFNNMFGGSMDYTQDHTLSDPSVTNHVELAGGSIDNVVIGDEPINFFAV